MRKVITAILLLCGLSAASAQFTAEWFFQDYTQNAQAVKQVNVTALWIATPFGTNYIIGQRQVHQTGAGGMLVISNMVPGAYKVDFIGAQNFTGYATNSFTNVFALGTTGLVNAYTNLGAATNTFQTFDSRYAFRVSPSTIGYVATATDTDGNYDWEPGGGSGGGISAANATNIINASSGVIQTNGTNLTFQFASAGTNVIDARTSIASNALVSTVSGWNTASNSANLLQFAPKNVWKTNNVQDMTARTGNGGGSATNATPDWSGQLATSNFGPPENYLWRATGTSPGQWSGNWSFDFSQPGYFGNHENMPYTSGSPGWVFWVNGNRGNQTNDVGPSDVVARFINGNLWHYSQISVVGVVTNAVSGGVTEDYANNWASFGSGNPLSREAFAGQAFTVVIWQPYSICQTTNVGTNGIVGEPSASLDTFPDHQVTTWDFLHGKTHWGHLVPNVYSFTNAGWIDAFLLDYVNDTLSVRSNVVAQSGIFTNLTSPSLTANTLIMADANKKEISIANGNGFITNNGAGGFGYFPFSSLPGASSGGNYSTNANGSAIFTGPITNSLGYFGSAMNIGGQSAMSTLVLTNGFTNLAFTASTLLVADANKKAVSVPNGVGAATNDGSGNFGYVPLLDASTLGANSHVKTGSTTNLISSEDATGYTNTVAWTHEGTTTNITATFNGTLQSFTCTNGPSTGQDYFIHFAGANGSVSYRFSGSAVNTLHFDYQPKWMAGSNNVITNGVLSITSYGGTNATQLEAAIGENQ